MILPPVLAGMGEPGGIIISTGERVFGGLVNSFQRVPDEKKRKYLAIAFAAILITEISVYVGVSWQGDGRDIPFTATAIDLGDFKPRAKKAPVIEIDEVFGNQFVKEKKDASMLPANEAAGSLDGEGVTDLDVEGTGSGGGIPDIGRCAVRNFPAEAKAYVETALVVTQLTIDKTGVVREAKPLYVKFDAVLPPELKDRMKALFLNAARTSLLGKRCGTYPPGGPPINYRLEVPLSYELN